MGKRKDEHEWRDSMSADSTLVDESEASTLAEDFGNTPGHQKTGQAARISWITALFMQCASVLFLLACFWPDLSGIVCLNLKKSVLRMHSNTCVTIFVIPTGALKDALGAENEKYVDASGGFLNKIMAGKIEDKAASATPYFNAARALVIAIIGIDFVTFLVIATSAHLGVPREEGEERWEKKAVIISHQISFWTSFSCTVGLAAGIYVLKAGDAIDLPVSIGEVDPGYASYLVVGSVIATLFSMMAYNRLYNRWPIYSLLFGNCRKSRDKDEDEESGRESTLSDESAESREEKGRRRTSYR